MLCYRDVTFCKHYHGCKKAAVCPRPLTPEVKKDAEEWWGPSNGGAPIATFLNQPDCYEAEETEDA